MDFQVSSETIQRRVPVTVLHLAGSLNLGSAEAFEQAARQVVEQGARYVLLDLKDVPAVRSAGLRSLQILYNMLNPKGAASAPAEKPVPSPYLKAANLSPEVHYVFDVAGFLQNISCYDDVETALDSFG
jgi:anti-anti-sigma factor